MKNVNPRVTDLNQIMAELAEPGKLFIPNFYHDTGCPANEEGGTLQDCECLVLMSLECFDVEGPAQPQETGPPGLPDPLV